MNLARISRILPTWQNAVLALVAAGLLILAFPDFEFWFLAWVALVPLMWAVERQKDSVAACFTLGWIFGTAFFFGTCWWLTYAPIHYAAFPWPLAYFLMLVVALAVGVFPALFTTILAVVIRRFGSWAFLAAPFVWVFTEFLRYWLTGNNWNALAYSQALSSTYEGWSGLLSQTAVEFARFGGVALVSFIGMIANSVILGIVMVRTKKAIALCAGVIVVSVFGFFLSFMGSIPDSSQEDRSAATIVAIQPNVPMSGYDLGKWSELRHRQIEMAESGIKGRFASSNNPFYWQQVHPELPVIAVLPESPMNFMYHDDREFQQFIGDFARRNNVSVLFNSAEPDATNGKYFNSAVMVGPDGREAAQYDKIFLLPFGEAVPSPLDRIVPGFVGNFSYGREYDILPVGDAKAGVMICFESHFGQLSREYVRNGADVLIEMTNDGYLGPTPVLRQHLANAVFRAVETNRPVLRVTNVGVTAYITENGQVLDAAPTYQEATRVWSVSKSDGSQTFYVKYGDWFAWLCTVVTLILLAFSFRRVPHVAEARTE